MDIAWNDGTLRAARIHVATACEVLTLSMPAGTGPVIVTREDDGTVLKPEDETRIGTHAVTTFRAVAPGAHVLSPRSARDHSGIQDIRRDLGGG